MTEPEKAFKEWFQQHMYETEQRRLRARLDRAEWGEIFAYFLTFVWILAMFVAYQLGWVSAALAALVTLWVIGAGLIVAWSVRRYQRVVRRQLEDLETRYERKPQSTE